MNISNKNLISLIKTYTDTGIDKAGKGGPAAKKGDSAQATDEVRLSAFSQDIQKIEAGLQQIKDVRQERVQELKARIEAGTYDVSGKEIAEKMIDKIIDLTA
jgi:negative regulator of flagellin synthesis FlgM